MKRSMFRVAACVVAATWAIACSDSNGTGESPFATTIQLIDGDQQEGLPGAALADSLVVRVVDPRGSGVGGVSVNFVVTAGGGSVSPAKATTNAEGYAAAEWVLGRTFDTQAVEARAEGLDGSPIEFTAQVIEPSTVAIGDTVLGMISAEGEIDTFTLTGAEGQEINIFFQPLTGSNPLYLQFYEQFGTPSQRVLDATSAWEASDLHEHYTGRIVLPADGVYTIVVRGELLEYVGPYRFYVFPIDRNPESIASAVAVGDTIEGESISPKSDIDVFTFEGKAGEEIEIHFQPLQQPAGTVQLRVVEYHSRPSGRVIGGANGSAANEQQGAESGRIALPYDGTYSIMIVDLYDGYEGAYRFHIAPIDRNPESVPSTVAIGDTIEGESISPGSDVDVFTFTGTAGQDINIFFQPLSGSDSLTLEFYEQYGTPGQRLLKAVKALATSDLHEYHTGRVPLLADGTYTIVVCGPPRGKESPYRFQVFPIDRGPESIPSTVAIGDTIDGESIGPKGDVDEFTFTGTAGQQVEVLFQPLGENQWLNLYVYERYGTPDARLLRWIYTTSRDELDDVRTAPFTLSADATYTIRIDGYFSDSVSPYRFAVLPWQSP